MAKSIILVVDDEPLMLRLLGELLQKDYRVLIATNGPEALQRAEGKERPDLILLDVLMPEMDGYEVCRHLKGHASTNDIPIIFLTARNESREEARGLALGAVDYISKPFDPAIVQARIARHLTLRRLHRELAEQNARLAAEIEERKRIEEALRLAKEQAEAATRAKSEFLANMNHELRTPLHAVLGFASLLQESPQTPRNKGYLETIQSAGRSLLQLIDDILDLSKIEAGKIDIRIQPVDLRTLLREVQTLFRQRAAEHGLDLRYQVAEEVPSLLQLDEVRLRQILINLVGNALKFTERGSVRITATGPRTKTEHLWLRIAVEDTGIGIPADAQTEIFNLFAQGPGQERARSKGTGLGLGISQRLAHLMGGEIHLDSTPGRGSTFTLLLPAASWVGESPIRPQEATQLDSNLVFATAKILIVEHVPSNRELLVGYLAPYGFTLREAADGAQALAAIQEWQPDLILTDISLPVLDGLEMARRLKTNPETATIPILAVCTPLLGDRALEIESVCDGTLPKPLSKAQLIAALQNFLPHMGGSTPRDQSALPDVDFSEIRLPEPLGRQLQAIQLPYTSINEIEALAQALIEASQNTRDPRLAEAGHYLLEQAQTFDLGAIATAVETVRRWLGGQWPVVSGQFLDSH